MNLYNIIVQFFLQDTHFYQVDVSLSLLLWVWRLNTEFFLALVKLLEHAIGPFDRIIFLNLIDVFLRALLFENI